MQHKQQIRELDDTQLMTLAAVNNNMSGTTF